MSSLPSPLKSPPAPPSPWFPAAWASARFPAGICTGAGTTVSAKATPPEGRLPADTRTAVTSNDAASNARLTIAFIVPPSAASTSRLRELRRVDQVVAVGWSPLVPRWRENELVQLLEDVSTYQTPLPGRHRAMSIRP